MKRLFGSLPRDPQAGVNPAISDSSTFRFDSAAQMHGLIEGEVDGRFIYSRHLNPSTVHLSALLASLEGTPAAHVTASGMAAISAVVLQLCSAGDEIVSSRTIYGGTYALFRNVLPRFGITTRLVDQEDLVVLEEAITPRTRLLYCESMSNPLLEVPDLPALSAIAKRHGIPLVVDNTFTPLIIAPRRHGADIVVHSLTKFINGMGDALGGAVCADAELIEALLDIESGTCLTLGGIMDGMRAAAIAKNLHTLHVRLRQHGENALFLATALEERGYDVFYPGLASHPHHGRMSRLMTPGCSHGGMLAVDAGAPDVADHVVTALQRAGLGYIAVSLGYFRSLFTLPSSSTSAEISANEQEDMGLRPGLIRISVGLDPDMDALLRGVVDALESADVRRAIAGA